MTISALNSFNIRLIPIDMIAVESLAYQFVLGKTMQALTANRLLNPT
jgi:hypothetical protein